MEFVLCIVVALTTLDPISLGTIVYLICFRYMGDALEACHILKKMSSPCAFWSQAWMSVNSHLLHRQCYLGNKYLTHAYSSSSQTLCRLFFGMSISKLHLTWFLQSSFQNIFIANVSKPG